jgi:hypothetical protein
MGIWTPGRTRGASGWRVRSGLVGAENQACAGESKIEISTSHSSASESGNSIFVWYLVTGLMCTCPLAV